MAEDAFRKAEDAYFRLKGQLSTGRLTRAQYEAALKELMLQDARGRYWMLGTDSGKWFVHEGETWIEANPYSGASSGGAVMPPVELPERSQATARAPGDSAAAPPRAPSSASASSSGSGCGGCLVKGCLALIILIVLVVGGTYLAFQSGVLTTDTLLNLAGLGPGDIEVDNFRDEAVQVRIQQLDVPEDSTPVQARLDLNAFDIKSFRASNPGKYRVTFALADGGTALGNCTLTIRSGDYYQFVTLPDQIVVNRANNPATVGSDLIVTTSQFCR